MANSDHDVKPSRQLRYYTRNSIVRFEEDATHEFKGHRELCEEELPPWIVLPNSDKRSRAPVSRVLNGFLNSGRAATCYLGIPDDGTVKGLNLTVLSKDHLISSLDDLMSRYDPPVEPHRYSIEFIPVVDEDATEDEIIKILTYDGSKEVTMEQRKRQHLLRTCKYCWCHKDECAKYAYGIMSLEYIVEIHIAAWDPNNPENKYASGDMKMPPVHEDECGRAYFRRQASNIQFTPNELYQMKRGNVRRHYDTIITDLHNELHQLRLQAVNNT